MTTGYLKTLEDDNKRLRKCIRDLLDNINPGNDMQRWPGSLAQWATERFQNNWSLDDVKQHMKAAMDIVEKQK